MTFGHETLGRRRLGTRTFGCKDIRRKTFGCEMRCSALFTIIFLLFSKNFIVAIVLVSVLIVSNFLITASNKQTNQLMYTYENVVGKTNAKARSSYR